MPSAECRVPSADLYVGRALALRVTRFDQLASGLIQRVALAVDDRRGGRRGPEPACIAYALQNVGPMANTGWALRQVNSRSRRRVREGGAAPG